MEENGNPSSMALCRVTQLALLQLLNNPAVMGDDVCTGRVAWRILDQLMSDERFAFKAEPPAIEQQLRRYTADVRQSPKLWQDAYLAAFAYTAGFTLVTFDAGFRQFRGLRTIILGRYHQQ
jgi:toxin-antitoxin system PIN domain toxin